MPLDTSDPKYQAYFKRVRDKIRATWVYPRLAGERGIQGRDAIIEFHIAKDGSLESVSLRSSTGVAILDNAALTAVKMAQPFPPVPDDVATQTLAISGRFRYQLAPGSGSAPSGAASSSPGQTPSPTK